MKKLSFSALAVAVTFLFSSNVSIAKDFSIISDNQVVTTALNKLEGVGRNDVIAILEGKNPTGKPIKIEFKNLSRTPYGATDAVLLKTFKGNLLICINEVNEDAPVETIACLIAHESVHNKGAGTFEEELRAWVCETQTWIAFVKKDPVLKYDSSRLVTRLNYISNLYSPEDESNSSIKNFIAKLPAYSKLK